MWTDDGGERKNSDNWIVEMLISRQDTKLVLVVTKLDANAAINAKETGVNCATQLIAPE